MQRQNSSGYNDGLGADLKELHTAVDELRGCVDAESVTRCLQQQKELRAVVEELRTELVSCADAEGVTQQLHAERKEREAAIEEIKQHLSELEGQIGEHQDGENKSKCST